MYYCLTPLLLFALVGQQDSIDTKARFEAVAGNLKIFPGYPFGRQISSSSKIPQPMLKSWLEIRNEVLSPKHQAKDLIALLEHQNAKVRTLALFALFEKEDPQYMPHIASLLNDKAATAPRPQDQIARTVLHPPPPLKLLPQKVGDISKLMVRLWLEQVGDHSKDFPDYWAARKNRQYCAGWFGFRRERIENVHRRNDKGNDVNRLKKLRRDIDQLPPMDRNWTLLLLATWDYYHPGFNQIDKNLAQEEELLEAAKRLGRVKLLDFLQGKKVSKDPDLAPDGMIRNTLRIWILERADQLLKSQDANLLLKLEEKFSSPWWAIGAAKLQPKQAQKILKSALKKFSEKSAPASWDRAYVAANLARSVKDTSFLVKWFYDEPVQSHPHTTQLEVFLRYLKTLTEVSFQKKLAHDLIQHKRLKKLDYQPLRSLVQFVNTLNEEPIIEPQMLFIHSRPPTQGDQKEFDRWRSELRKWAKKKAGD